MFVHVINSLAGGGAEKQVLGLASLSDLPHEVIDMESLGEGSLWKLDRELATLNPAAVMAWLDRSQIATALVARPRVPLIANICGLPRRTGIARMRLLAAYRRFTAFVANSEASRAATREFARSFAAEWFEVVPNGVEVAEARVLRNTIDGPLRVGFIGRGDVAKGVDVLGAALSEFSADDLQATLVGRVVREALPNPHLPAIDKVVGGSEDPWRAVGDIDVLVVPSRSEGSPNVVIEAFARGIPVVATVAGGTEELLRDGRGLLVPVGDAQALADALRQVRGGWDEIRTMVGRAHDYARRVHAWPRIVAGYDDLLVRVAGS